MTLKEEQIIHKIWGRNEFNHFNWIGKVSISKRYMKAKVKKTKKLKIKRSEFLRL